MMEPYHKINTVFERDPGTRHKMLLVGEWQRPEFEYLQDLDWEWTEKVDGCPIIKDEEYWDLDCPMIGKRLEADPESRKFVRPQECKERMV